MKKITIRKRWFWFNAAWCVEDEYTKDIRNTGTIWNLPSRLIIFTWQQWIAHRVCKVIGHKWIKTPDCDYSYCKRCADDTEITYYE